MNDVVDRLQGLTTNGHVGDWMDVLARAERRRATDLRRRALIAAAALLLLTVPALALAYRLSDVLVVSEERSDPPTPWIADDRLHDFGGIDNRRRAAPLAWHLSSPPLFNTSGAIASPDRRLLLYRTADPPGIPFNARATPVLRQHDLQTGHDRVVERGAATFAWRADGALAYAKAEPGTPVDPVGTLGHVFVRPSISAPAVRWTPERARYTVLAWAGENLLVGAIAPDAAPARSETVYAFSGPRRARKLPLAGIVAIDPSGELVVGPVTLEPLLKGGLTFRVVRVRDGKVLAQRDLPSIVAPRALYGSHAVTGGSWADEYIVVAFASAGEELRDALVVLRFDGTLETTHVFRLEPSSAAEAGFGSEPYAFHSPLFLDKEGREIVAWAGITERDGRDVFLASVFLRCDRAAKRCRRTDPLPGTRYQITGQEGYGGPITVTAFVQNPSRPLPD
jgi:hypothetical protein